MKSQGFSVLAFLGISSLLLLPAVGRAQAPVGDEAPPSDTAVSTPAVEPAPSADVTTDTPVPSEPEAGVGIELKAPLAPDLLKEEPQASKNDRPRLEASLKEGVLLRTYDNKAEVKLGASVHLDARGYFSPHTAAPSSFDIRRARFELTSKFYDLLVIRFQAAFEDQPYIRAALVEIGLHDAFRLSVGQMKVPFSTGWLTADNHVDFLEAATAEPVYPYIDRGVMLWGSFLDDALTYNLGAFNGTGSDLDTNKGDIDGGKDVVGRLFVQPFAALDTPALKRIYLVAEGTYGNMSAPTRRYETRGLTAADFESQVWRWRTEQTLGTDGRNTDQIAARADRRARMGAEAHYILGSFAMSAEWLRVNYQDIQVFHQFWQGAKRLKNTEVLKRNATIDSLSVWASWFFTGESKTVDNYGWRQPLPKDPIDANNHGWGAWELLGRFSGTRTSRYLFNTDKSTVKVNGFTAADFDATVPVLVGEGNSVTAAIVEGAPLLYETSLGLNWTMNYNLRVMATATYLWAPDYSKDVSGTGHNGLLSGANSESSYPLKKNRIVKDELMIGMRLIMRI